MLNTQFSASTPFPGVMHTLPLLHDPDFFWYWCAWYHELLASGVLCQCFGLSVDRYDALVDNVSLLSLWFIWSNFLMSGSILFPKWPAAPSYIQICHILCSLYMLGTCSLFSFFAPRISFVQIQVYMSLT